jgi:hypothetical protein
MKKKTKQPLMHKSHLAFMLLGAAMTGYGLVTALVGSWFSNQAMRGLITAGAYRSRLAAFDQSAGLVAGILFLALFIWCAVASRGIARVAFCFGALATFPTLLSGRAQLLPVPSAFSGPVIAILFALPMTILFIMLACGGRLPRNCRWVAFASIFIVLATAIFPIYVLLTISKIPVGDPAILTFGRLVDVSTNVIKLRYLLPGLSFLFMAFLSMRFASKQALEAEAADNVIEKGETK